MKSGWAIVVVQPGEENPAERPYRSLPVLGGGFKTIGDGLFTGVWSDKIRGNDFKLKKGSFRLDTGK